MLHSDLKYVREKLKISKEEVAKRTHTSNNYVEVNESMFVEAVDFYYIDTFIKLCATKLKHNYNDETLKDILKNGGTIGRYICSFFMSTDFDKIKFFEVYDLKAALDYAKDYMFHTLVHLPKSKDEVGSIVCKQASTTDIYESDFAYDGLGNIIKERY